MLMPYSRNRGVLISIVTSLSGNPMGHRLPRLQVYAVPQLNDGPVVSRTGGACRLGPNPGFISEHATKNSFNTTSPRIFLTLARPVKTIGAGHAA